MRNGFGVYVVPASPCIFGGFSGSSAWKVNLCRSATVLINSSVLDNCSPGHARFPESKQAITLWSGKISKIGTQKCMLHMYQTKKIEQI